jgi:hypothetical protein
MSPLTLKIAKEAMRASERLPIEDGLTYERDSSPLLRPRTRRRGRSLPRQACPEWKAIGATMTTATASQTSPHTEP